MAATDKDTQVRDVRYWISNLIGEDLSEDEPLHEQLKDGVVLCRVGNVLIPGSCKIQKSKFPFKQMENVQAFLALARRVGVPDSENFQTVDLFENKNFQQVLHCMYSLSRNAAKNGYDVQVMGPKLKDKNQRNFTEEQLRAGLYIPSKTMGNNLGANASGVRYGLSRQVVSPDPMGILAPKAPSRDSMNNSQGSMTQSDEFGSARSGSTRDDLSERTGSFAGSQFGSVDRVGAVNWRS